VRANSHIIKAEYELAVADYGKWIELKPKDSMAYFNRGDSYEKMGNVQKAIDDYQKAVELDANNESAKNNLQRLQAGQPKTSPKPQNKEAASISDSSAVPQTVELGELNGFAVNLVTPVYPETAKKMNAQGKVTVQITLDKEGNVVLSKAVSGHTLLRSSGEEAARKSKFKPARVGNQAVKATGFIVYNFVRQAS
jgi:TonB family protein